MMQLIRTAIALWQELMIYILWNYHFRFRIATKSPTFWYHWVYGNGVSFCLHCPFCPFFLRFCICICVNDKEFASWFVKEFNNFVSPMWSRYLISKTNCTTIPGLLIPSLEWDTTKAHLRTQRLATHHQASLSVYFFLVCTISRLCNCAFHTRCLIPRRSKWFYNVLK